METPKQIKKIGNEAIHIVWSNDKQITLSSKVLRENCPSAVSKAKRGDTSHDKPLSGKSSMLQIVEATAEEELSLEKIWAIGNYAIGMKWADGHDTGIYTYDYLKELSNI